MANTKPYVAAALVCENVIQEKDHVLTAIRIVDTFFIPPRPLDLPAIVQSGIIPTLFLGVKAGSLKGTFQTRLRLRTPSGKAIDIGTQLVVLNGEETGANWIVKFPMASDEMGMYWFDFYWEKDLLTSIPLKLSPQPVANPPTAATG